MKYFDVTLCVILLALLCPTNNGQILELSGLRPDLETLRGYWLQNPGEHDRQGSIAFNQTTRNKILINYGFTASINETCPSEFSDWTNRSLHLEGVLVLTSNTSTITFNDLFYKDGTFFGRNKHGCDLPEPVDEAEYSVVVPIYQSYGKRKVIELSYTDLKGLGYGIEQEISKINKNAGLLGRTQETPAGSVLNELSLDYGHHGFVYKYRTGDRYVHVLHVRILETSVPSRFTPTHIEQDYVQEEPSKRKIAVYFSGHQNSAHHVSLSVSSDYSFIRYDRHTKAFYTPKYELLDDGWLVRSYRCHLVKEFPKVEKRRRTNPFHKIAQFFWSGSQGKTGKLDPGFEVRSIPTPSPS